MGRTREGGADEPSHSHGWDSSPGSATAAAGTPSVPLRASAVSPTSWTRNSEYTNTLLVATNEQGEVKVYVNGQIVPLTTPSGPRDAQDLGICLHVGPNASRAAPVVVLDYIHAWQERITL